MLYLNQSDQLSINIGPGDASIMTWVTGRVGNWDNWGLPKSGKYVKILHENIFVNFMLLRNKSNCLRLMASFILKSPSNFRWPVSLHCVYIDSITALHSWETNRPRSIYQYSSMAPRLSGQNCKFFKFPLSLNSHKRVRYKENNTKYRGLTWKPRSHVRILIYRTWPIHSF